jgi:hypothetical protein
MMQSTAKQTVVMRNSILYEHGLLIAIVLGYASIAYVVNSLYNSGIQANRVGGLLLHFIEMLPTMGYLILLWRFLYATYVVRPANRIEWLKADILRAVTDRDRLLFGFLAASLMVLFLVSFAWMKQLIPIFIPFSWDQTFSDLDQLFFFGTQPYELLDVVFAHPFIISFFAGAYSFWLFLLYFVLLACCFGVTDARSRMQYLVAFTLTWALGGNLLATLFSSAGPVYYERLGLGDTYVPLMQMLKDASTFPVNSVLELQETLWTLYAHPVSLNAISAMPSMHVGSTVLMAIYAFQLGRWAGIVASIFAGVIMIGSVVLGWHYAVDGYLGALVAFGSWKASGWLITSRIGPFRPGVTA